MVGYCAQFVAAVTVAVVAPESTWGNLVQIGFAYGGAWLCVYAVVGCYAGTKCACALRALVLPVSVVLM